MYLSVNAFNVINELARILRENLEFAEDVPVKFEDTSVAEMLARKFAQITCNYLSLMEEELIWDENAANDTSFVDDEGKIYSRKIYEGDNYVSMERKAQILKVIEDNPKWKWTTIQKRFPALKHKNYPLKWKKQIEKGGSKYEKLKELDQFVIGKFNEARDDCKIVHDMDIRRWAMQYALILPCFPFKASGTWLSNFKTRHGIGSRKVQRVVSKREIIEKAKLEEDCSKFREKMKEETKRYDPKYIWNTDQVGIQYELTGTRTLTFKGERVTYGFAHSPKNRATHSYTVQPTINLEGEIVGDFFVCLQEAKGKLGPKVEESLLYAPNLTLSCSSSGKMSKTHVAFFLEKVLKPEATQDFLLSYDSYSGQKDPNLYLNCFGSSCKSVVIPPKCTSMVQALDTGFNRQLKYIMRQFYEFAALHEADDMETRLTTRNDILKMLSLSHFILSAPIFKGLIRHAWVMAGILDEPGLPVLNVRDGCFKVTGRDCKMGNCNEQPFLLCPWCKKTCCFFHFYHEYHIMECEESPWQDPTAYEKYNKVPIQDPELIALEEALRSAESALEATEIILDSVVPGCSKEPGAHQKPSNVQLDATTLPVQPAADENNIQQQATEPTGNADKTTEIVKDNARGRGGSRRGAKMRGGSKKEKPS